MKATLVHRKEFAYKDGRVEMVVWGVPKPIDPSSHPFKYRLVYIVNGVRVVGYDNERGKGDHKHLKGEEFPYLFVDIPTLMADFLKDVRE